MNNDDDPDVIDLETVRLFRQLLPAARAARAARLARERNGGAAPDRCPWCGHEVSAESLLGHSLANGALPRIQEHALRALRLHTDELGELRKMVAAAFAELLELRARQRLSSEQLSALRARISEPVALWRSITPQQRLDMMARTCRACGTFDGCSCKRE